MITRYIFLVWKITEAIFRVNISVSGNGRTSPLSTTDITVSIVFSNFFLFCIPFPKISNTNFLTTIYCMTYDKFQACLYTKSKPNFKSFNRFLSKTLHCKALNAWRSQNMHICYYNSSVALSAYVLFSSNTFKKI